MFWTQYGRHFFLVSTFKVFEPTDFNEILYERLTIVGHPNLHI
jgi:hypothetical protein